MFEKVTEWFRKDFVLGFCVGFCVCFLCSYTGSGGSNGASSSTLGAINANESVAAGAVGDALAAGSAAGKAIEAASSGTAALQGRIDRSAELAVQGAAGLGQIRAELARCTELARKNQQLIEQARSTAQSGAGQGGCR